jgi:tRNA-intron endonuclease, archaea type
MPKKSSAQEARVTPSKPPVRALLSDEHILLENSNEARDLYNSSRFGELDAAGKVQLSMIESLYLLEKERISVSTDTGRKLTFEGFLKKAKKLQPGIWTRYLVFRDMRNRGYIVKTALKFGADFRVYDRGVKPGDDHAKWVLFPIHEGQQLTWHDFAAKNRVAHSTKKRLLIGIVDEETEVTYYEVAWTRP